MKSIKTGWVIHVFAFLHAAVALCCGLYGIEDELLLTVLTIAMALIICLKQELRIEFVATIIIVVNILGFLLGTLGANLLALVLTSEYAIHALSTAVTTEVLGWSMIAITKVLRQSSAYMDTSRQSSSYLRWLLLAAGGIFVLRLCVVLLFSDGPFGGVNITAATENLLSNSVALTILVCINILYIRYTVRGSRSWPLYRKILVFTGVTIGATSLETVLTGLGLPFKLNPDFTNELPSLFAVSLLAQITIYCIVYMINSAITAKSEMQDARERANMEQYRYLKLKRQVNPHFLFNSLNILDCLICEEKKEQASKYTHKLAGIYRYMIKSEDEEIVPLRDELVFAELYVDLLKVRFPEGFDVELCVPDEMMARYVLPCSIQLLIENATKHNAISTDDPLLVRVECVGEAIMVSNNINPKMTSSPSTGLGQKYIRQMYMDLSGKHIEIKKTAEQYSVTLPLL